MKKLILILVVVITTGSAYAQTDSAQKKMSPSDNTNSNGNWNNTQNPSNQGNRESNNAGTPMKDCIAMKNGKMIMVKSGKTTVMDKDVTLSNGTKVTTNGSIIKSDGSKTMMKEGEHIDMSGTIMPMKNTGTTGKNNMYLVPDNTKTNPNK